MLANAGDVASRNALALECLVDLPNQEIFSILMDHWRRTQYAHPILSPEAQGTC